MFKRIIIASILLMSMINVKAQTDRNNVPKPPLNQLAIYKPFFGRYKITSNYAGLPWHGTLEIKPVIKNWYVEQVIKIKSADNKIDREFHMMVTYDTTQNKYRVWRFETLPPIAGETVLRTEGNDIILEMQVPPLNPGGKPQIFYNRYSKPSKNKIKAVSELHALDGKMIQFIGETTGDKI